MKPTKNIIRICCPQCKRVKNVIPFERKQAVLYTKYDNEEIKLKSGIILIRDCFCTVCGRYRLIHEKEQKKLSKYVQKC